ncbi:hypothetical protein ARMGADRAFT_1034951 [Armillaria gallica]|uniref:F-box domain-containing protein n=1 Tax=Armillaria gallica TaxID=47427 RepID=A0A2H3DE69_ARMGA|nr:hypothetical protein ARMGADRAFT_1034951 [Armillaria gallica]
MCESSCFAQNAIRVTTSRIQALVWLRSESDIAAMYSIVRQSQRHAKAVFFIGIALPTLNQPKTLLLLLNTLQNLDALSIQIRTSKKCSRRIIKLARGLQIPSLTVLKTNLEHEALAIFLNTHPAIQELHLLGAGCSADDCALSQVEAAQHLMTLAAPGSCARHLIPYSPVTSLTLNSVSRSQLPLIHTALVRAREPIRKLHVSFDGRIPRVITDLLGTTCTDAVSALRLDEEGPMLKQTYPWSDSRAWTVELQACRRLKRFHLFTWDMIAFPVGEQDAEEALLESWFGTNVQATMEDVIICYAGGSARGSNDVGEERNTSSDVLEIWDVDKPVYTVDSQKNLHA